MDDKQIIHLTKKLVKIVKASSKIYMGKNFQEQYDKHKFDNDDVTNLDIETQAFIKEKVFQIFHDCNFIGEEEQQKSNSSISIIVDPIDGTFNFKHNIKNFGTQVCVLEKNSPIISVLYLPNENKVYYANKFGAFENGKRIFVSNCNDINSSVVELGDFNPNFIKTQQQYMNILSKNFKRVRINGSSCVDSCLLARGSVDLYIIYTKNPWDLLPGKYLIEQSGGVAKANKQNNTIIMGNKKIVDKAIELLNFE